MIDVITQSSALIFILALLSVTSIVISTIAVVIILRSIIEDRRRQSLRDIERSIDTVSNDTQHHNDV